MHDQFGEQGIVVRRNDVAADDVGIDPHADPAGQLPPRDATGRWRESDRILSVDAAFDRMAGHGDVGLRQGQLLAARDPDLLLHDVDPADHLRHRVLDLQPSVHLDEMEGAVLV